MDPYTGRVTEHYANAAWSALAAGTPPAALLAMVAAHALPACLTPLDHLCR